MLKKLFFVSILSVVVVGLLIFGSPTTKASADSADNLAKASVGILAGWSEVFVYPAQQVSKPGWCGKILLPLNIVFGGVKGLAREAGGVADCLTFFKERNIINSYPGEEL